MSTDLGETTKRFEKGRGALSNASGRFETFQRFDLPDDPSGDADDLPAPRLRTRVTPDSSRSVIARNDSPDIPFDRSINPYRGCEHGCIYCFARPTHAWLGLSPGLDFETKLLAKHDAAGLLRQELARPGYRPAPLALGTNTDPYQPVERRFCITRRVLEVLAEARHPVTIVTKSNLILRDRDILSDMAKLRLVKVALSITSLDRELARTMEPRAPTPFRRLEALQMLATAGVPVGVMTAPMIPAINDDEMEAILEAASDHGATEAGYILLRLPLEIKDLFEEWLERHFPDRKARVLGLIRETRGGALYDSAWGKRMKGEGHYAKLLADRFKLACRRIGLNRTDGSLATDLFKRPPKDPLQLDLL